MRPLLLLHRSYLLSPFVLLYVNVTADIASVAAPDIGYLYPATRAENNSIFKVVSVHIENSKTLMKEIEEASNKWENISC